MGIILFKNTLYTLVHVHLCNGRKRPFDPDGNFFLAFDRNLHIKISSTKY